MYLELALDRAQTDSCPCFNLLWRSNVFGTPGVLADWKDDTLFQSPLEI